MDRTWGRNRSQMTWMRPEPSWRLELWIFMAVSIGICLTLWILSVPLTESKYSKTISGIPGTLLLMVMAKVLKSCISAAGCFSYAWCLPSFTFGCWISAAYSAYSCLILTLFLHYFHLMFTVSHLIFTLFSPYFHHFLMFCWKLHFCSIFCLFLPYSHTIFAMPLKTAFLQQILLILTLFSPYFHLIFTTFWCFAENCLFAAYSAYSCLILTLFLLYCWKLHFCSKFCLFSPYSHLIFTLFSPLFDVLLKTAFLQHILLIPALFSHYFCYAAENCIFAANSAYSDLILTLFSPYFHHFLMFCWKLHLCSIFCFFLPYSHTIFAMFLKSCIFAADSAYSCLILTLFSPYFCLIFTTFWIFCWKLHFCSIFCLFLPYSCIILTFFHHIFEILLNKDGFLQRIFLFLTYSWYSHFLFLDSLLVIMLKILAFIFHRQWFSWYSQIANYSPSCPSKSIQFNMLLTNCHANPDSLISSC